MAAQNLDPRRLNQLLEGVKAELTEAPGLYARANQLAQKAVIALQDAGLTLDARKVKAAMPCRDTISASKLAKALDLAAQSADEVSNDGASEAAGEALDAVNQAADFAVARGLERPAPGKPRPAEEPAEESIQPNTPLTQEEQDKIRALLQSEAIEGEPEAISKIREIVRKHQAARVGGTMVDAFTASAIVQVYDALNDANKVKFAKMPIRQMADVTWKLVGKGEAADRAGSVTESVQLEYATGLTVDKLAAAYTDALAKFYKQKGITHLDATKQAKKILAQGQAWARKGSHADLFGMNQTLAQVAKSLGFANSEALRKFLGAQKPLATEAILSQLAGMKAIAECAPPPPAGALTQEEKARIRQLLAG